MCNNFLFLPLFSNFLSIQKDNQALKKWKKIYPKKNKKKEEDMKEECNQMIYLA